MNKKLAGETGRYLFFGVLTSLVNYGAFWLAIRLLGEELALGANLVSFVCAVTFAFVTNKLWVFESPGWAPAALKAELPLFVGGRLASFGLEEAGLALAMALGANGPWLMFWKVALSFGAVALNYIISKLLVFKKK